MKKLGLLLTSVCLLNTSFIPGPEVKKLRIFIESNSSGGDIHVAIYENKVDFLTQYVFTSEVKKSTYDTTSFLFSLQKGEYAVSVYHDVNGNGVFDKNWLGIPKEPYGFSRNARKKFGPPEFEDSRIFLDKDEYISIGLE